MKKTKNQLLTSWFMVLMMLLNLFVPGAVYAADINTSILTSITKTITQNNVTILSGGAIDSTKPIRVDISFGVPVLGDEGATIETAVTKGAVVVFEISDAFTLTSSSDIELKMGTIKVGTATFSTTSPGGMVVATVVFDCVDADSGNYARVNITDTNSIRIFSKVDTAITIRTIEIHKY